MVEIARLSVFAIFMILAAHVAWRRTRAAVNVFLAYTIGASVAIGVTQLDAWPFSTYRLANQTWAGHANDTWTKVRFFAVDAREREWELDPEVFAPLHLVSMQFYFRDVYPKLSAGDRIDLGRFLMRRAEASRRAIREDRWFGNERLLGPLAAPDWSLYARHRAAPADPYVAVRVVREFWKPAERLNDPRAFTRNIILEFRG